MRESATVRMLPDGRRLHLSDGPIDLILWADGPSESVRSAYAAAAARFATILDELCGELALLRSRSTARSAQPNGVVARRMADAVAPYYEKWFITPMAAVAGAVAEEILKAITASAELKRGYVNNGGDIALHLWGSERLRIGMVERPDRPSLFGAVEIAATDRARGVATSGWRGRSFSLGIADAVTVLADRAADADAAATILANAVDLPEHEGVLRVAAREIAPDSDLGEMLVTRGVPELAPSEIARALESGARVAEEMLDRGLILAVAMHLQGETRTISHHLEWRAIENNHRSMAHA